jgi:DNA uptake protein ComE-like DNA-binding protein
MLERNRESLAARAPAHVRPKARYECLCLLKMVTRLQRDYLSQPTRGGDRGPGSVEPLEFGIADWARPWGPSCLLQLQADLNVFDHKLKSSRRWLSAATQREVEARAGERFAVIVARLGNDLKVAEFAQPGWASSAQLKSQRSPARDKPRAGSRPRATRRAASRRAKPRPAAPVADRRLDLNEASYEQLRSLDLSSTQCHRLLAHRERLGGFQSIDQLDRVPGLPKGTRDRLRHRLTV